MFVDCVFLMGILLVKFILVHYVTCYSYKLYLIFFQAEKYMYFSN